MDNRIPSRSPGPPDGEPGPPGDGQDALLTRQGAAASARVTSLERQLRDLAEEQALTTHDDEHDPEGMTIGYQRAQFQSLLDAARADLAAVEHARKRLREGTYGRCGRCGAPIGVHRLSALPATLTCIDCARRTRPGRAR
jgi:RNA polymerase-binding transcription factor DksA